LQETIHDLYFAPLSGGENYTPRRLYENGMQSSALLTIKSPLKETAEKGILLRPFFVRSGENFR
jgi:hypothetical protein